MGVNRVNRWVAAVLGLAAVAHADLPDAPPSEDFLRRTLGANYVNCAVNEYRPYRREIRLSNRFDYLGNFLAEGFLVYEMDERRPGESRIRKDRLYRSLNNLIIAQDSYGPASWALTVGDEVRTQLTPLTLRQAGFNGLRWDVAFPSNKVTLLVTRGFDSSLFPTLNTFSTPLEQGQGTIIDFLERTEENPVFNFAGHWETRVGDVVRFGATLVNQHQVNTASGSPGGFLRGSIPYQEIQASSELRVRIGDDSPSRSSWRWTVRASSWASSPSRTAPFASSRPARTTSPSSPTAVPSTPVTSPKPSPLAAAVPRAAMPMGRVSYGLTPEPAGRRSQ